MDHRLWPILSEDYRKFEEDAPDGWVPVVTVSFLAGLPSIEVEYSRARGDQPWVMFQLRNEKADGERDKPHRDEQLFYVDSALIAGATLSYRLLELEERPPVGFRAES